MNITQQTLKVEIAEGIVMNTDEMMLSRVLDNLLTNTSELSDPGSSIYVACFRDNEGLIFYGRQGD